MLPRARNARIVLTAWALSCGLLTWTAAAGATPSAKLTYVRRAGTETCPDEQGFRKAVAARLGYDPFFPAAPKTVVAELGRRVGGFTARVEIVGDDGVARGERSLDQGGDDCAEIVNALALAVSLALDDLDQGAPAPAAPEPAPAPATPPPDDRPFAPGDATPPATTPSEVPPPATPEAPPPVEVRLRLGGHGTLGTAPALAVGGDAGADVRAGAFGLGVEAIVDAPSSSEGDRVGRVAASSYAFGIAACLQGGIVRVCALAQLARFHGEGRDIAAPRDDDAWLGAFGGRLGLEVPFGQRFFVAPNVDVLAPVPRETIDVDGQPAFVQSAVVGRVGVGVGVRVL